MVKAFEGFMNIYLYINYVSCISAYRIHSDKLLLHVYNFRTLYRKNDAQFYINISVVFCQMFLDTILLMIYSYQNLY